MNATLQVKCPLVLCCVNKDLNVTRNSSKISQDSLSGFQGCYRVEVNKNFFFKIMSLCKYSTVSTVSSLVFQHLSQFLSSCHIRLLRRGSHLSKMNRANAEM